MRPALLVLYAACLACAQTPDAPVSFEVASIKPSPPPEPNRGYSVFCKGGPGTTDPGLLTCSNYNLWNLLSKAFNLHSYQLPGADYGGAARYEVAAKIPPGTTKDQFSEMLRQLLIERFGLKYHYEKKEMEVFDLTVAKGGLKIKEAAPEPAPQEDAKVADPAAPDFRIAKSVDGFPAVAKPTRGNSNMSMMAGGRARWIGNAVGMENIVSMIGGQLDGPVTDSTGLKGKYDLTLSWVAEMATSTSASADPAPSFAEAVMQQLGLKIEKKKGMVDIFVVDHAEKSPIEN